MPVVNSAVNGGYYPTGTLHISSTTDENGHETREYHDRDGLLIVKMRYASGGVPDHISSGNWTRTYYVYDDFNKLRFVFQPELTKYLLNSGIACNPSALSPGASQKIQDYIPISKYVGRYVVDLDSLTDLSYRIIGFKWERH